MLLITKGEFWEPTMLMKTNKIAMICHDVYENTMFIGAPGQNLVPKLSSDRATYFSPWLEKL